MSGPIGQRRPESFTPLCRAILIAGALCHCIVMVKSRKSIWVKPLAWMALWPASWCAHNPLFAQIQSAKPEPGLAVMFTPLDEKSPPADAATTPNTLLYVEAGRPPTPFLPAGRFTAVWDGWLTVDLRGDFHFEAELNGHLKLELNGATALEVTGNGGASPRSKPVRLNKGTNALKATFISPNRGDAFVRLAWTEQGAFTSPIPAAMLSHTPAPGERQGTQLRLGRELFLERRCVKCHSAGVTAEGVPELGMDAPSFEGIGARRSYDWMARWILDPKKLRPAAQMPKLLHGPEAKEEAEAMAAFLASLKSGAQVVFSEAAANTGQPAAHATEPTSLFEMLHCVACHDAPDSLGADPSRISLKQVAEKFAPGKLAEFLRRPEAHYAWIRMPNLKLSATEAQTLSDLLLAAAEKANENPPPVDKTILTRGRKLVQTTGCLNCHTLPLENQFSAKTLAELDAQRWQAGQKTGVRCLGSSADPVSTPKRFQFTENELESLRAFARHEMKQWSSLSHHGPVEFAERQSRALNCAGCHGKFEGFPPLEMLGGKLQPEWMAAFIAGDIPYKPRAEKHPRGETWLPARMPVFRSRAALLAAGLAMQHGYPPHTPSEPPIDTEAALIGQKLIGKEGGFSCISCHGVGRQPATEVADSEGINLAHSGARLLRPYFFCWLYAPLSLDPQTKMPAYFEAGKSALTDFYAGDAERQINAMWQYIRLGDKMPPPKTGDGQ